ncbi:alkaline phosphatase family protein [Kribbella qitaiheensis]|uniref:Alkaline phosphatase family protein n=1 Tax=Kribbella qitaiheensis TaxID=1544730 RepID=A0A7G6X305_9ACTN|nr:alkaline phosphatase D family protein [Kribbella qitaiheensis]QNE20620.1 alkaline phosphatase family protein [Kribbella qitaiheensis]
MQLKLGPLLRYVDETRATVWVETDEPCTVEILGHRAPTWTVHGHHYALVLIEGLTPASETPYEVRLDDSQVWPLADSPYGPSVIRTPRADGSFRLTFGSCRRSAPFDEQGFKDFGPDALVALAERMAGGEAERPDAVLLLGDQVYADDPSDAVLAKLRAAHGGRQGSEVADEIGNFEEYTWLYDDAWLTPAVRWLFSTVPLCMLLDDHDLRDDWNTSLSWRRWVTAQPWWHDRVVGAYASYWVYQHLGNLSPEQLEKDPTYAAMRALDDEDERSSYLDAFAWEADDDPASTRWSFYRDFGARSKGVRLVAIDSRCSRELQPEKRAMVDQHEWEWVRRHTVGATQPINHLLLASTLPFLLAPGLHHLEGWNEAVASGAWGHRAADVGEKIRQEMDLEHWASFRNSFDDVTDLLTDLVRGENPPASILMLSGDVHCSYLAEAELAAVDHPGTAIRQLTMSPFRNPIGRHIQLANKLLDTWWMTALLHKLARSAGVRDVAARWRTAYGPWFGNGVMTVTAADDRWLIEVDHAALSGDRQILRRTVEHGG